jgi:hypothetical protein
MSWMPFSNKRAPLTGAPAVRRLKTYSAQSGYVYQYFYQGYRPFREGRRTGLEFVFEVSGDRKQWQSVAVFVGDEAAGGWEASHQRPLSQTERYAIAKMALFQAFDDRAEPAEMKNDVHVRPADVDAILEILGL